MLLLGALQDFISLKVRDRLQQFGDFVAKELETGEVRLSCLPFACVRVSWPALQSKINDIVAKKHEGVAAASFLQKSNASVNLPAKAGWFKKSCAALDYKYKIWQARIEVVPGKEPYPTPSKLIKVATVPL